MQLRRGGWCIGVGAIERCSLRYRVRQSGSFWLDSSRCIQLSLQLQFPNFKPEIETGGQV